MPALESIFRSLDGPLWVVTAAADGERGGLIASVVTKVSLSDETPRVVIGIGKGHRTWSLIERSRAFGLHLVPDARADWIERFAAASSREVDKFAGLAIELGATGSPLLLDAPIRLDCVVESRWDIVDRTMYLGAVAGGADAIPPGFRPLTMGSAVPRLSAETLAILSASRESDARRDADLIRAGRTDEFNRIISKGRT